MVRLEPRLERFWCGQVRYTGDSAGQAGNRRASRANYDPYFMATTLRLALSFLLSSVACDHATNQLTTLPSAPSIAQQPPPIALVAPMAQPSVAPPTPQLPSQWPHQSPSVVTSKRGMVVTDNAQASRVGSEVLARGGNAADAAVATAFALAVAYPTAGNIGGGGFAVTLFHGSARALDFRETAPASARPEKFVDAEGKPTQASRQGILSVGVPGSVAGMWELARTLGSKKLSFAQLLAPAIDLARQGFVVDQAFHQGIMDRAERLSTHKASTKLFLPNGAPPKVESIWKNPELAGVLERIARSGPDEFYRGKTAQALASQMRAEGGLVTLADLDGYQVKWREPLKFTYRDATIVSMPPPSSGGVTLAMICHILQDIDLRRWGAQSPYTLHVMFEAMRRSFAARNAELGDPDFVKMPLERLLSADWAANQRVSIQPDRATPSADIASAGRPDSGGPHTTHFSVVNAEGNAVAVTTTINWWYGSGVTAIAGGFVLNNEMDDFAVVPGAVNGYGLVQGEANALAPGKRMLSSMSPTIVLDRNGQIELILGAAGGPTIITSVFEELSNVVNFELPPAIAVGLPRFHMQHLPDVVTYEKDGITDDTREKLVQMGYSFKERDHIADAPLIGRVGSEWVGVAEPRRAGALASAPQR